MVAMFVGPFPTKHEARTCTSRSEDVTVVLLSRGNSRGRSGHMNMTCYMTAMCAAATTTWVLLRGLGRESAHWGTLPQRLQAAFPSSAVVTPDLPGTGAGATTVCPLTVPALAHAVRQDVLAQGGAPPFSLVGLSLGSMVALAWAQQNPTEVARLALLSGSVAGLCPLWWRLTPAALRVFAKAAYARNGAQREALILRLTSANPDAREAALSAWVDIARQRPVSRATLLRQLAAAARFRPTVRPFGLPTLVLAGARDAIVNAKCSERLASALHAPVFIHPTAGHDLSLDAADWVLHRLQDMDAR